MLARRDIPWHDRHAERAAEFDRAQNALIGWASGKSYKYLSEVHHLTVPQIRSLIVGHLRAYMVTRQKWAMAEFRCHVLAMENRLLRLGKECPADQPIETLNPPARWLYQYKKVGIDTVNQLRSVDAELLLTNWHFPIQALDWGWMTLDRMGLSHVLCRPQPKKRVRPPKKKKRPRAKREKKAPPPKKPVHNPVVKHHERGWTVKRIVLDRLAKLHPVDKVEGAPGVEPPPGR